jgi:hypothetical protein
MTCEKPRLLNNNHQQLEKHLIAELTLYEKYHRRKLRRWIWVMYFLYKNEYRIWNHKKGWNHKKVEGRKKKNRGDEPIRVIIHTYMEMSQWNSL